MLLAWAVAAAAHNNLFLECCSVFHSPESMINILQSDLSTLNSNIYSSIPYVGRAQGPKLVVTFITRVTEAILPYAAFSAFLQASYCRQQGYALLITNNSFAQVDYITFPKLSFILETMTTGRGIHSDYIVWIDADLIILDLNFRIEELAAKYPRANILISADVSSSANTEVQTKRLQ